MQFATAKEKLRASIKENEARTGEKERKEKDLEIFNRFFSLKPEKHKEVFVYVSCGSEVETSGIIKRFLEHSSKVYVPLCHGKGKMEAKRIFSLSDLSPGRYGIPEPEASAEGCEPSELSLIVVPGLCFGEDLTRLGRGAGYYDRFLEKAENAISIALCREENIRKTVPCDEHDRKVDMIITEKRVIRSEEKRGI